MKFFILFKFNEGAWGGGNQFLKSLISEFQRQGKHSDNINEADVVLVNSHHEWESAFDLKMRSLSIPVIHRIDGPLSSYRSDGTVVDSRIYFLNQAISDGTVFQSEWSRSKNQENGFEPKCFTIIPNAPDPSVFFPGSRELFSSDKIKVISSSWSRNPLKGFDTLKWLDENLDFDKINFTFIGNSPVSFKNISIQAPILPNELANVYREFDIFLFPSKVECCSNSLSEAMACGLPVIASNLTSNPEVIQNHELLFDCPEEIPNLIEKISKKPGGYVQSPESISGIVQQYLKFAQEVSRKKRSRSAIGVSIKKKRFMMNVFFDKIREKVTRRLLGSQ